MKKRLRVEETGPKVRPKIRWSKKHGEWIKKWPKATKRTTGDNPRLLASNARAIGSNPRNNGANIRGEVVKVLVGIGRRCPTCMSQMERYQHGRDWRPRIGHHFFLWCDTCKCGHVQHYMEARRDYRNDDLIASFVAKPASYEGMTNKSDCVVHHRPYSNE